MTITRNTFNEMTEDQKSTWDAIDSLYRGAQGDYNFETKVLTVSVFAPLATATDIEIDLKDAKVDWQSYTISERAGMFTIIVG